VGGLFAKAKAFARSPQGKRAMRQAGDYAKSPEGKRQISGLRSRFAKGPKSKRKP
jgi:hypothetical protein